MKNSPCCKKSQKILKCCLCLFNSVFHDGRIILEHYLDTDSFSSSPDFCQSNPVYTIFYLCIYQSGGETFNSPCQFWLLYICLVICWKRNKKMINHRQCLLTSCCDYFIYLLFWFLSLYMLQDSVINISYILEEIKNRLNVGNVYYLSSQRLYLPVSYLQMQTLNYTLLLLGLLFSKDPS